MKYRIRHVTGYRYTAPVNHAIQLLRLTPRNEAHQRVLRWHIAAPAALHGSMDAYGNVSHVLTLDRQHDSIELAASGVVHIAPLHDGQLGRDGSLPVQVYRLHTPLTQPSPAVMAFCHQALPKGLHSPADALQLAAAICGAVRYEPGVTDVTTVAERVLELGHGVCQDHAHLFLACARGLQRAARYVSGYLHTQIEHAASHAWVDVWFDELGWVSVDVTNQQFASDAHCRLAVARDYDSASPVRGVRRGGGAESMTVDVQVQPQDQQ